MVDETKPPPNWRVEATAYDDEDEPHVFRPYGSGPLSVAHRIAREEAQPYIAEHQAQLLERLAVWCEDEFCADSMAEYLREMATGARPLPGGKP